VFAQESPPLHDAVEGAPIRSVNAIMIVKFAWSIDAKADKKIVLLEKGAPLVIEKNAIGLKGV
jgi:hypothetical protein